MSRRPLRLLAAAGVVTPASACSPSDPEPAAAPSATPTPATPSATPSPAAPSATPSALAGPTCEPYPTERVELLLQSAAAPAPGPVQSPVSVQTSLPGAAGPVYIIAFTLGDKSVVLAHPVNPGEDATAGGTFVSLTSYTEQVTVQPRDPAVEDALDGAAVNAALDCLS